MVACVWEIADALDELRTPAAVPNSVWVEIPTRRLRGDAARPNNAWLRECLRRLTKVELSGEHRGNPWGAVVLAEWEITQGGTLARLLVPPSGVLALRSPATFAKIEEHAAHRLIGHARQLYALIADKRRLRRPSWEYDLGELRALLNVDDRKSYRRWDNFRARVLDPAVASINDFGTITLKMTPKKLGRAVAAVRFDWDWKDPREAARTAVENERAEVARRKEPGIPAAPPLIPEPSDLQDRERAKAESWFASLSEPEREDWRGRIGRTYSVIGPGGVELGGKRPDRDTALAAYRQTFID